MKIFLFITILFLILLVAFIFYAQSEALTERQFSKNNTVTFPFGLLRHSKMNQDESIRVVTWNIGYASGMTNNQGLVLTESEHRAYLDQMVSLLKEKNPDFIFLQEVDFSAKRSHDINQFEYLAKALHMPFGAYTVLWNKAYVPFPYWPLTKQFGRVVSGQAVLSRFPILEQTVVTFQKPPHAFWYNWFYLDRVQQKIKIDFGDENLFLWNVHHEAFHAQTRLNQALALSKSIFSEEARFKIVAGDFNDPTNTDSLKLRHPNYHHTFDVLNADSRLTSDSKYFGANSFTFPSENPIEKLDHVLLSEGFEFQNRQVVCSPASDHCLVFVDLKKRQK